MAWRASIGVQATAGNGTGQMGRIDAKRLRYALEFFASLASRRTRTETVKTLASLQGKKTAKKVVRQPGRTVSSVARDLIIAGRSNDEVWKALKQEFKLDSSKKHYPAWYRSEVKRKGLIK